MLNQLPPPVQPLPPPSKFADGKIFTDESPVADEPQTAKPALGELKRKPSSFGKSSDSVLPLADFMHVREQTILRAKGQDDGGLSTMEREFELKGTAEDRECFQYCAYGKTGSNKKVWDNGVLDQGRADGLTLDDFVGLKEAKKAHLSRAHVLALRLYTTTCFRSLNNPMRGLDWAGNPSELSDENPHPFPVTMDLLADGIKRLRANETENAEETIVLWRGLRNVALPAEFLQHGGSEKAPMSTTRDLSVAVQYSASGCAVLLKLVVEGFHQLGADLAFLSAFPGEKEVLYPPLTHLRPTGRSQKVDVHATHRDVEYEVYEVKVSIG